MKNKKGRSMVQWMLTSVAVSLCFSACRLNDADVASILSNMSRRKAEVEKFLLTGEGSQKHIQNYFASFDRMVEAMDSSERTLGKKISYVGYFGADKVCTDLFLAPGLYQQALNKCGQGIQFFARIPCEDTIWLNYRRNVQRWFDLLDQSTQDAVLASSTCRERIESVGVDTLW